MATPNSPQQINRDLLPDMILALLPPGTSLSREPGSNTYEYATSFAELVGDFAVQYLGTVVNELQPGKTAEIIMQWENAVFGDISCYDITNLSLQQRRDAIIDRIRGNTVRPTVPNLQQRLRTLTGNPTIDISEGRPFRVNTEIDQRLDIAASIVLQNILPLPGQTIAEAEEQVRCFLAEIIAFDIRRYFGETTISDATLALWQYVNFQWPVVSAWRGV